MLELTAGLLELTKGLLELHDRGVISRLPRVAVIQAAGASPLHAAWVGGHELKPVKAKTLATAIQIGAPVSFTKSIAVGALLPHQVSSGSTDDCRGRIADESAGNLQ